MHGTLDPRSFDPNILPMDAFELTGARDDSVRFIALKAPWRFGPVCDTEWHLVGGAGEPAFANSWVNFGATDAYPAGFKLVSDTAVRLRGLVKSGTITTTIFTLPVGYRPLYSVRVPVVSNGAFGYCRIESSGAVVAFAGNNASFSLDNIVFEIQ